VAGIKTRRRQLEAAAGSNVLFSAPGGAGGTGTIFGGASLAATSTPVFQTAQAAFGGAGLNPGQYVDSNGKVRNADGSRAVGGATLKARSKVTVAGASVSKSTLWIIAGVVVGVGLLIWYRKTHPPKGYVERVADSVRKAHASITGAAKSFNA